MSTFAVICCWLVIGLLLYVYAGFPTLLAVLGQLRDRRVPKAAITPRMTLIIAAYNEEECIGSRIDNALAADYPTNELEIIVASDGSTDETETIVERYAHQGVRLLRLPRRGKIFALSDAAQLAQGDILVFSDANTMMERGALRALACNFADPAVGGVVACTGYHIRAHSESSSRGENLYWRYDTWLKELESRTGSVVSAHGGLYAIRRDLYRQPKDSAVTDDFMISTAVVEQGFRLVFERGARAWEDAVPTSDREFQRRVRLMTRGWRGVALRRNLLNPVRYGFYALVLLTHKVLRRLVPVALLLLLPSSLWLSTTNQFFSVLVLVQCVFYGLGAAGYFARGTALGKLKFLFVPFFYCLANLAALFALLKFARGERIVSWQPQRHATHA